MQLCFEKPDQNILVLTSSISWSTPVTCVFQGTELTMDKDFPESLLSAEVAQESQHGQDLDRQLQDHEDQNPDGQNPTQVRGELEVLGHNKDPRLASGQEADCLDLDHGKENRVSGGVWRPVKAFCSYKYLLINFFPLIYE